MSAFRVALCLGGQLRAAATCVQSLTDNVYRPLVDHGAVVDTFIHTQSCNGAASDLYRHLRPTVCEEDDRPLDVTWLTEDKFDMVKYEGVHRSIRSNVKSGFMGLAHPLYVWQMVQAKGLIYDWAIFTRPDARFWPIHIEHINDLLPSYDHPILMVPGHDNWWGLNERFYMGAWNAMATALTRFNWLGEYCADHKLHSESFFKWVVRTQVPGCEIKRTRVINNLIRGNGLMMPTIWQPELGDDLALRDDALWKRNKLAVQVSVLEHTTV